MSCYIDYMGLPDNIDTIGDIYPISILEWEKFSRLAYKYFMFSYDFLRLKLKITDDKVKVFDYLMLAILSEKDEKLRLSMLKELEELFSLILKKPVNGFLNNHDGSFIFKIDGSKKQINRDNFDDFKKIVFRQNILFEPVFAPNERSQKYIDMAIRTLSKDGSPIDIEAMLVYVSNAKKMKPSEFVEYTYYQLRADCEMEMRKENNRDINMARTQGAKISPVNLLEKLNIHKNPYGKEALFKKVNRNEDSQLKKMMKR